MNHQHVGAFIKTVDWTDLDAVSVLALDAVFANDERHINHPNKIWDNPAQAVRRTAKKGGDEKRGSVTERRGLSSRLELLAGFPFGKFLQAIEDV